MALQSARTLPLPIFWKLFFTDATKLAQPHQPELCYVTTTACSLASNELDHWKASYHLRTREPQADWIKIALRSPARPFRLFQSKQRRIANFNHYRRYVLFAEQMTEDFGNLGIFPTVRIYLPICKMVFYIRWVLSSWSMKTKILQNH